MASMSGSPPPARRAVETTTRRAVLARDAGLRRVSAVTRWTAAGVLALSGALALVASKAFHGHVAAAATPPQTQTQTPTQTPSETPTPQIQQPQQAPTPVQQAPVAVSGGS